MVIGVGCHSRHRLRIVIDRSLAYFRVLLRTLMLCSVGSNLTVAAPSLPISSWLYIFQHHYAEQSSMPSITLLAKINGHHIVSINQSKSDIFPLGVIVDGELAWHAQSKQ